MNNAVIIKKIANRLVSKYKLSVPVDFSFLQHEGYALKYEFILDDVDAILFNKEIIINIERAKVRQRFTIAHETGHIFIPWHTGAFSCANIEEEIAESNEYFINEEEANLFASELLMPDVWISSIFNGKKPKDYVQVILDIMLQANVSLDAAFRRVMRFLPKGFIGLIYKKSQMYQYVMASGDERIESIGNKIDLIDNYCNRISSFNNGDTVIILWEYNADLLNQCIKKISNCQNCTEAINLEILNERGVCIPCLVSHLVKKLSSEEFIVFQHDGIIERIFRKENRGYNIYLKSIKEISEHYDLRGIKQFNHYTCAVFKYRTIKKLGNYTGGTMSTDIIKNILLDLNIFDESILQSINGIIGASKSEYDLITADDYYEMLQKRFIGRENLKSIVSHPDFDSFLKAKAVEISKRPRSKKRIKKM